MISLRKPKKLEGWYEKKRYPHFDCPLEFPEAKKLVTNPPLIARHAFYPLLSYEQKNRRFKGHNQISIKSRPIKYASHRDGYIYAYYTQNLLVEYEAIITKLGLQKHVLAYRRNLGSNIEFAKQAFLEIKDRKNCIAIALDISGFFNNIDHENLKKEWCKVLSKEKLPEDHYAIFKSLTYWSEVDKDQCLERLQTNKKEAKSPLLPTPKDFRNFIKGKSGEYVSLIRGNKDSSNKWMNRGIPQGAQPSALLSNIYMLPFDEKMKKLTGAIEGYYCRYSDDILLVCDEVHQESILAAVHDELKNRGEFLSVNEDKTEVSVFSNGNLVSGKIFQYLGFQFDGKNVYIRSQTLSRYWGKVTKGMRVIKNKTKAAQRKGIKGSAMRKKKLYQKFTHLGKNNFPRGYAYRAEKIMGHIGYPIRKQMAGHFEKIKKELLKTSLTIN